MRGQKSLTSSCRVAHEVGADIISRQFVITRQSLEMTLPLRMAVIEEHSRIFGEKLTLYLVEVHCRASSVQQGKKRKMLSTLRQSTDRSPNFSCKLLAYLICSMTSISEPANNYIPYSPARPICPSRPIARYAHQYQASQQQPHPARIDHISVFAQSPSASNTHDSKIFKRPRLLNVLQCLLQILQLPIDLPLRFLCALHSLRLEGIDRL